MVDIARMSGVSIATVSRVLNKNGRYSAETEKKVMAVVEKYNYAINPNAQGLRTNRTKTIGVIIPDITNEYFSQIVRSVESTVIPMGYNVFVCDSDENVDYESHHIASLQSKGVEGIIYFSVENRATKFQRNLRFPLFTLTDVRVLNLTSFLLTTKRAASSQRRSLSKRAAER